MACSNVADLGNGKPVLWLLVGPFKGLFFLAAVCTSPPGPLTGSHPFGMSSARYLFTTSILGKDGYGTPEWFEVFRVPSLKGALKKVASKRKRNNWKTPVKYRKRLCLHGTDNPWKKRRFEIWEGGDGSGRLAFQDLTDYWDGCSSTQSASRSGSSRTDSTNCAGHLPTLDSDSNP